MSSTRRKPGRPLGSSTPPDVRAVKQLLDECRRRLRFGTPCVSPKSGEVVVGEDGKPKMRPLNGSELNAIRATLRELGAFRAARQPKTQGIVAESLAKVRTQAARGSGRARIDGEQADESAGRIARLEAELDQTRRQIMAAERSPDDATAAE